jgi:rRNA maturation RNase YbeY
MPALAFSNRQRTKPLNPRRLRQITESILASLPQVKDWDLAFYFVGAARMAEINESHLGHPGPTDVITFDYNDPENPGRIAGEVFICVEVAVEQAREFRTTWQSEVVRYVVHSILHLCGYDDLKPTERRRMKLVENRLVARLSREFKFTSLGVR